MKIALCHYSCPSNVGGIENLLEKQSIALRRNNHLVKVIAGSGNKFSRDIDVDINPMLSAGILGMYEDVKANDVKRIMEPQILSIMDFLEYSLSSFDILIVHNVLTMPYNIPLTHAITRIARKGGIRVLSWNHDSPFFHEPHQDACPASWEILRQASPGIRYVCATDALKEGFEKLYGPGTDITVIPCGIFVSDFISLQNETYLLIDENHLYDRDLLLLHPARYHQDKNIEFSIRVVEALVHEGVNPVLMLTAVIDPHDPVSVEYHDRMKRLVSEKNLSSHVLFISDFFYRHLSSPAIPRAVLKDLYQISDMLIMPNLREGYGTPLLEAAVSRLPIAYSDIPAFRRFLGDDGCMFCLEKGPADAAEKIHRHASTCTGSMFRKVLRDYNGETLCRTRMLPLLHEIMKA